MTGPKSISGSNFIALNTDDRSIVVSEYIWLIFLIPIILSVLISVTWWKWDPEKQAFRWNWETEREKEKKTI